TLSVAVARLLAMRTDAVWFTPVGAVRDDLVNGTLVSVPVKTDGTEEPVGLLRRSDAQLGQAASALMKLLRDTAEQRRATGRDWTLGSGLKLSSSCGQIEGEILAGQSASLISGWASLFKRVTEAWRFDKASCGV